jgi:hypothetical protein
MATEDDPLGFDPDRDYSKGDRLKIAVGKYIRAILQLLVRAGQTGALVKSHTTGPGTGELKFRRVDYLLSYQSTIVWGPLSCGSGLYVCEAITSRNSEYAGCPNRDFPPSGSNPDLANCPMAWHHQHSATVLPQCLTRLRGQIQPERVSSSQPFLSTGCPNCRAMYHAQDALNAVDHTAARRKLAILPPLHLCVPATACEHAEAISGLVLKVRTLQKEVSASAAPASSTRAPLRTAGTPCLSEFRPAQPLAAIVARSSGDPLSIAQKGSTAPTATPVMKPTPPQHHRFMGAPVGSASAVWFLSPGWSACGCSRTAADFWQPPAPPLRRSRLHTYLVQYQYREGHQNAHTPPT